MYTSSGYEKMKQILGLKIELLDCFYAKKIALRKQSYESASRFRQEERLIKEKISLFIRQLQEEMESLAFDADGIEKKLDLNEILFEFSAWDPSLTEKINAAVSKLEAQWYALNKDHKHNEAEALHEELLKVKSLAKSTRIFDASRNFS